MNPQILTIVTGISGIFGLLGLMAYLFFQQQVSRAEQSVREIVEGEGLFNASQVLEILKQFSDDTARLEALKALTHHDGAKANNILTKVNANVDIKSLANISHHNYRTASKITASIFSVIAIVGLSYCFYVPSLKQVSTLVEGVELFTEQSDGRSYPFGEIGNQTWMLSNLNYHSENQKSWCYDDESSFCQKHGHLYTWNSAQAACPAGWHLPSKAEWIELIDYLGGSKMAGPRMLKGGDSGFDVLLSGNRRADGNYYDIGSYAAFWTSDEHNRGYGLRVDFPVFGSNVLISHELKVFGFPVRCVKD